MSESIVMEFITLCIDNFNNNGHSSTKEQEHRYYELKHQIDSDHEKAEKWDMHVHVCDYYKVKTPEEAVGEINSLRKEIKQLKEINQTMIENNFESKLQKERDNLKQKLEKIKQWCQTYAYPTKDGFREQEFSGLKEVLGEEPLEPNAIS